MANLQCIFIIRRWYLCGTCQYCMASFVIFPFRGAWVRVGELLHMRAGTIQLRLLTFSHLHHSSSFLYRHTQSLTRSLSVVSCATSRARLDGPVSLLESYVRCPGILSQKTVLAGPISGHKRLRLRYVTFDFQVERVHQLPCG
jgi:hypothetical protein